MYKTQGENHFLQQRLLIKVYRPLGVANIPFKCIFFFFDFQGVFIVSAVTRYNLMIFHHFLVLVLFFFLAQLCQRQVLLPRTIQYVNIFTEYPIFLSSRDNSGP
jgi:hypothetical protein